MGTEGERGTETTGATTRRARRRPCVGGVCARVDLAKLVRRKQRRTERALAAAGDEQGKATAGGDRGNGASTAVGEELCLLNGVAASLGSGILGWVIGFGSGIIRLKVEGSRFRTSIQKANSSSKTFGLMGGMYTFMACASRKIRGKDDAVNLAIAGCASGIALGWEALQSCAGMAAFSWFFDGKRLNTDIEEAS
ncbi:mitochondrial inner membrane translocase [Chloropicon primus]|nr:mitochondrial inner membrane translocase [Chloropicon primus]